MEMSFRSYYAAKNPLLRHNQNFNSKKKLDEDKIFLDEDKCVLCVLSMYPKFAFWFTIKRNPKHEHF